jgi:deoxyribodipyrimidine photolyase-related protein
MNLGLLTPHEVLEGALDFASKKGTPLASLEGFVRQVVGWREFVRGIYQNFREREESTNAFGHTARLTQAWYQGDTGIVPLDEVLAKVFHRGYAHHIERLMVLGNIMLLSGVHPVEAHRWFMEMFVDSADWVMGPNVYGMSQMSDGGLFATKPYVCGSNYLLKMGPWKKGPWCDALDGLYWDFVEKNREFYAKNPRMSMILGTLDRISADRRRTLAQAANALKAVLVTESLPKIP